MKVLSALPDFKENCAESIRLLKDAGCEVVINELGRPMSYDDLKDIVSDIDAVMVGIDVWDKKMLDRAPNLKVIARFGVGVDNVDLEECKRRGIVVTNCTGINTNSVAEHTIMMILASMRFLAPCYCQSKEGGWPRLMHYELNGKTVGIMGFGAIGRRLAELLQPFGVKIIAYDKFPNEEAAKRLNVTLVSREEVLSQSDVVSLHTPALPETIHMINRDSIATMKDGAYLVNAARGPLVDEEAMAEALKSGKLAGYAADVFEHEPCQKEDPLFQCENYICTPHLAADSFETWAKTAVINAQAILDVFAGRTPDHKVV